MLWIIIAIINISTNKPEYVITTPVPASAYQSAEECQADVAKSMSDAADHASSGGNAIFNIKNEKLRIVATCVKRD